MIKHIVIWRLKDNTESETKEENIKLLKIKLESLKDKISAIKKLEVGINFNNKDVASDLVLYSEFLTEEDLESYQVHPEHRKVADFAKNVSSETRVVDYIALDKKKRKGCKC